MSRDNADDIAAAHRHPLIATIAPDAAYTGEFQDGASWRPVAGNPSVCGGHVQTVIAGAVLRGGTAVAHRTVITVTQPGLAPTRWTPTT
ncbi:hypothetical protein ACIRD8_35110 [Streptomyces sp. NPDC102451]|uniref:hypothetical protein n=1 Tax=Streptomyces sp. NPDC102451 TaxID=3366177 RepID=UPI003807F4A0